MDKIFNKILVENANLRPNNIAFICEDKVITYSELSNLTSKTISNLEAIGITSECNVALRFENPLGQFIFYLALLKMGVTQVSISLKDVMNTQKNILSLISIDVVIQDISLNNVIHENSMYVCENNNILSEKFHFKYKENHVNNDYAVVFNGSGTTSIPKTIAINRCILAEQIILDTICTDYKQEETYYTHSDLSYITSQRKITAALYSGLTIYLPKEKPKNLLSFCKKNKIEHLFLTTNQAMTLMPSKNTYRENNTAKVKLPSLKSLIITSSISVEPLRKNLLNFVTKNLYIAYGTNELGQVTIATTDDVLKHIGTVGKPLSGINLKIVNDNGEDCKVGEVGHILIKSENMINGYLNNSEATKKIFTKEGFYPGDLGKLTEDGNLILEGRKDDMMIFSGVNIYPRELESLLESHPNVIESAVFPLTVNDQQGVPFAVVVLHTKMQEKELLEWCHDKVGWRRPQKIFFIEKLPRNAAGKVLKRILAQDITKLSSTNIRF